jgi:hypothetical protein
LKIITEKLYQIEFEKKRDAERADRKNQMGSGD